MQIENELQVRQWRTESDAELVRLYREEKDQRAFDEIYHRYKRRIRAFLSVHVSNEHAVEDIVQETFLGFMRTCGSYDGKREFTKWIFQIAHYKLVDYLRKMGKKAEKVVLSGYERESQEDTEGGWILGSEPTPEEILSLEEERDRVLIAIATLAQKKPRSAKLLTLRYLYHVRNKELASWSGLSEQTIANQLSVARDHLKGTLSEILTLSIDSAQEYIQSLAAKVESIRAALHPPAKPLRGGLAPLTSSRPRTTRKGWQEIECGSIPLPPESLKEVTGVDEIVAA